jgi:hypothetical protein
VEGEVRPVRRGAGEEGTVFGGLLDGCMCVFGDVRVCICFEVGIPERYGLS